MAQYVKVGITNATPMIKLHPTRISPSLLLVKHGLVFRANNNAQWEKGEKKIKSQQVRFSE